MPVKNRIDLTNIEGSMTNIIHNNADRLYTAQSVRELYNTLLSIFRENNLDTKASRTLLTRVIEKHTVKQGLDAIFNSYFCGANMGREKEKVGEKLTMFKFDEKLKKIVSEEIEKIEVTTDDSEITVETEGEAVKVEIEPKCQGAECTEVDCTDVECDEAELDYDFFSDLNPEIDIDDEVPAEDVESTEDEEVVDEGFLGIKTKKEKEKEAKAKAEKERQKQRDKELKDQEERARQQATADSWARYDKAARDAKAEYNRSSSSQSSKVSNTGKAGVYYSGGDYYSESITESAQGTYSMRMYDYIDEYLDNEGRKDLCYAFTKWLSDDEVHEFAKANDLVPVFEDEEDLYEGIEKKYVKPLKDKIDACYTKQDLDEIGAYLDDFSDKDIDRILSGKVSNKDINKMFGGYNFVDDDFPGWDFKESKSIKESYSYSRIYEYIDSILGDCCRGERRWPKADPNDFARILEDEYNLESEEDYSWKDLCRVIHDIYPNGEYAGDELDESKSIKESLSVTEFIDWHETTNYKDNENTFEAVYSILDKYPDSEDDVKVQYTAASDEDKEAISKIIDKANETTTEEPTVYLARAMHKMYVDGYNYQEIADTLGAPVSLVIKMIGSDSYNESLTESNTVSKKALIKLCKYIENTLKWREEDYEQEDNTIYIQYGTTNGANEWDGTIIEQLKDMAYSLNIDFDIDYEPRGMEDTVKVILRHYNEY